MKPVDLFEYQIRNSARLGQIVLDPFGGSLRRGDRRPANGPAGPRDGTRRQVRRRDPPPLGGTGPRGGL